MQETLREKFEAMKQAVSDVNASINGIIVPAPQDIISLLAPSVEAAEKMAETYEQ